MRVARLNRTKWLEMVLGLLPITIIVGPLMGLGVLLVGVTAIFSISYGVNPFKTSDGSLQLFLSIFGGAAGLWALWWVFLFGGAEIRRHPRLHAVITLALLAGLAAGAYWLRQVGAETASRWYVKPVWFSALLGPLVLGMKYLFLLLRGPEPKTASPDANIQAD
ncbi:MAG TPA: hypothetical protein VFJ47_07765 [Terriglobales bacterium]|nr:hypothetical protein [Terriglobales bacterium]